MASKSFSNVKIKVSHLDLSKDASRSTLVSGENISHSLGKIARWYKDISWSGHKHTKADITDFAHTHTSLDTSIDVGSEYQPVYFLKGVPTALQYTIKTSVPANAVFTDTNTKVTSVGNHYTPSGGTTTSASGGTLTDITNSANGVQVVTGVTKDAAGHVTGVTSIALKSVNSNTVYAGGTGINIDANNVINHSNSITAITTAAFKKFKYDAQGHITGTANVTASDIPSHSHTVANITDFPVVITGGSQTSSSSSDGGSNIYTFTKSDGTSSTLTVKNGSKGSQGIQGVRGNGIYPITTAPESFTTTTGGFTPVYRATLSTVLSESKATEIKAGDQLRYSYYLYPVGYVDSTYVYLGTRTSIRGATGAGGAAATITVGTVTTGAAGSSASVTNSGTTAAAILDFVIPKGADGKNGTNGTNGTSATWFTGTVVTGTSTTATTFTVSGSKAGDMYLNTSTSNVYRASAANSWIYVCNIKGTAGTTPTLPTFSAEAGTNIGSVGTPSVSYNNGKFTFNYLKGAKGDKGDKGDPGTNATTTAVVSTSANGLAPKVTDTNKFLKGDGTWATPYTHPSYTSKTSGLYKITVDATGHISATAAVAKADIPALDYLSKSGGDVTGSINIKSSTIDGSLENNGVTAKTYPTTFSVFDKSSRILVRTEAIIDNNGSLGWYSYIRNYRTDGTQVAQKGIKFIMNKSGALTWTVDDSDNFRSAISAAASSHTHAVGDVTGGTNKQFLMSNGTKGEWHTLAKADIPALDYVPNTHATTTYGTCTTAAATAAKVVTLATNGAWTLKVGAIIAVKFSETNTANNPTLNVNNTGAKPIYYNTAVLTDANLSYAAYKDRVHIYAYDGTNYVYLGHSVDNNSTYSDMKAATASAAGTHGLAPAPAAGKQTYFLRGDATWTDVTPTLIGAAASSHNHSASDINSGTLSADRLATSGATAGSYGPSANVSPAHSGTFSVPYITVDAKGRVTAISTKTITLPASGNTDSNVSQSVTTTGNYRNVVLGYTNTSSASDDRTGTVTNVVYSTNKIFARPSEGRLYGEHLYAWVNSTDDVTVNLIRSGNSSWRFRNSSGNLFLENNFYSSKTQDWFPLIQFNYNATGDFSIETPPTATSTNRKTSLAYSGITFKGCSLNGWAMGVKWISDTGDILIKNGVYGTSAGAMTYMYWGTEYNATTNAMRYYQGATGLVTSCVNGFRVVQDGYGVFLRNYSGNFYILSTGKKTDGSEWTATYNSLRPVTINLATGLVTIGNGLTVTGTLTGTLSGNASTADRATNSNNCKTNVTDPNTLTSYGIVFVADPTTTEDNALRKSNDFRINHFRGAANTEGLTELILGNAVAKTAANNSTGRLTLYNANGMWVRLNSGSATSNIEVDMPSSSGTLALVGDNNHTHSYLPLSGGAVTGTISSSVNTSTHLNGNKGTNVIINSTNTAGAYTMLVKMNSTNGYFTHGSYQTRYELHYTAKSTVDAETNTITKNATLLDESGNASWPGKITGNSMVIYANAADAILEFDRGGGYYFGWRIVDTGGFLKFQHDAVTRKTFVTHLTLPNAVSTSIYNEETSIFTDNDIVVKGSNTQGPKICVSNGTQKVGIHIGSGGTNRGLYDFATSQWLIYNNGTNTILNGNASTSTKLATARTINGVSFDGSADITVPRSSIHVHTAQGSNGSTGWVKICDIKITGTYANHPLFFRIAQRGKPQFILTLLFENKDSTNINVTSFRTESISKVDFGGTATIVKASDNVTWGLYIQKTEAYDHIYVLDFSKANGDEGNKYTVTWTNVLSASKPTGGVDAQNKLSALKEETMLVTKGTTDYYGMMTPGEATNQWIRTTSLGLIPSESGAAGSGHCKLGTSSWYFSEAYIDKVYGTITNADNCNTTVTDPSTNTSYGIVFTIHPDTSEYNGMKKTNDFRLKHFRGAANTEGMTELVLGNSTAKTAADNSSGELSMYNENGKFTTFKPGTNSTGNLIIRLPDTAGTMTDIIYKTAKTASAVSNAGWTNATTDSNIVPTMSFIAYWNGRYNSSSSNLQYCDRGRFGTIVTKASGDYLAITGGTLTGDVTAPTFIGALTGNASTATKLKTARTLNTISFDGSANKIIPVQFCYHYDDSSDATTVSWHKVASTSITSTNSDKQITFYVVNNYSDTRTGGILKVYVRSGSTAGSYNKANLIWELKSSDAGMALANFVLVYTTNTTDGVFSAELWCKIAKRYESLKFVVLSMSDRTGKGNPNDAWTLYNTTDGASTYTSGTKAITSTLGLSTVPNTISRALYDTDGSDWINTIGIGWATSPLSADEADELACFTNKATVQGSPTHHIKNLQFSELKKKIEVVSDILFSGGTTSSTANIGYSVTDYQRLKIYATVNAMEVVVEIPALVGITRTIHAGTPSPASQTNNVFYGVLWQISDKTVSCAGGKTSTLTSSASLSSSGVATVIKKVVGYKY